MIKIIEFLVGKKIENTNAGVDKVNFYFVIPEENLLNKQYLIET